MYFHYAWVAMGYNNPFKKWITTLQISQFYSCLAHAVFIIMWDRERFPLRICAMQLGYHFTMIALFTGFFKETYNKTAKAAKVLAAEDITKHDVTKTHDTLKNRSPLPNIGM